MKVELQRNDTFGIDEDGWHTVCEYNNMEAMQAHWEQLIQHHQKIGDEVLLGCDELEGVLVACAPNGSQTAYRMISDTCPKCNEDQLIA
jgi:hypothetical protein